MEEDSDEEWNELMKCDMDDVFMEEAAICQAAMNHTLMLTMLMDEDGTSLFVIVEHKLDYKFRVLPCFS
jgi:hypothetical protein